MVLVALNRVARAGKAEVGRQCSGLSAREETIAEIEVVRVVSMVPPIFVPEWLE